MVLSRDVTAISSRYAEGNPSESTGLMLANLRYNSTERESLLEMIAKAVRP